MIIAHISDTHIDGQADDNRQRIENFTDTISDIARLEQAPDIIVHTGDLVHNGTREEYDTVQAILAEIETPAFVIPGNRDHRVNLRRSFVNPTYRNLHPEFVQYEIDGWPVHIVMVDTVCAMSNKGDYCPERLRHLAGLARHTPPRPTLAFTHHPPFDANACPDPFQFIDRTTMDRLIDGLSDLPDLKAVFCGHVHRFDIGNVAGKPAFAMPSVATTLRWGDYPPHLTRRPVYQIIEAGQNGAVSVETRIVQAF